MDFVLKVCFFLYGYYYLHFLVISISMKYLFHPLNFKSVSFTLKSLL